MHAGELETSLMLAISPHLVQMDKAVTLFRIPRKLCLVCLYSWSTAAATAVGLRDWSRFGEDGVTGDATLATEAKGKEIIARLVNALAGHLATHLFVRPTDAHHFGASIPGQA